MSAVVIVGAQWGDEGKGKIVDFCTEAADVVVRYAGGPNAGHTLVVGDDKIVVRLLPSGILREGTRCVLGQGMVIDPGVLLHEIDEFRLRGKGELVSRLAVSDRAHLILPYHIQIDALREASAGSEALGTTKKGIGPAYEDKVRRTGVRAGELKDAAVLRRRIGAALAAWAPTIQALGGPVPSVDEVLEPLLPMADRLVPLLKDTSELLHQAIRDGARVLLEGAQGTLLDVDHGTYPYVTSSTAVAGGAAVGAGIGPSRIRTVLGVTKAYATRVGAGPFPTELDDATGRHLRDIGVEFGSVTGRPRRTGWLDLPALRYAARVNGLDGLAITKLDVLTGIDRLRVCVAYDTPTGRTETLPIDRLDEPGSVHPVYQELPGWRDRLGKERTLGDLPPAALDYVRFLEHSSGVPVYMVSVGARRDQTIVLVDPFVSAARSS
jgi:adenylosuccinate synthase